MDMNDRLHDRPARLLVDVAEGRLDPTEIDTLEHLLNAEEWAPPPWVLRRAERIARQRRPQRERPAAIWSTVTPRLIACLAFDSQAQPQYVGMRAVETHVRRLLFQAENIEVDLEMAPSRAADRVRLAGQITAGGTNPTGGYLRLSRVDSERVTTLDQTGEFWVEDLEPGAYRLEIVFGKRILEVPVLPL
jgi:hypothetical protein